MKQYSLLRYYRGFEFRFSVAAKNAKQAIEHLDCSMYEFQNYGVTNKTVDPVCLSQPGTVFCKFGYGGEVRYVFTGLKPVMIPADVVKKAADAYREKIKTYRDTMKLVESGGNPYEIPEFAAILKEYKE